MREMSKRNGKPREVSPGLWVWRTATTGTWNVSFGNPTDTRSTLLRVGLTEAEALSYAQPAAAQEQGS